MHIHDIYAAFSGAFRGVIIPQTAIWRPFRQNLLKVWERLFDGSSLAFTDGGFVREFAMTSRGHFLYLESLEHIPLRVPHW
jgi:hypothetical protein